MNGVRLIEDHDRMLIEILKGIERATPINDTESRRALWERCWGENQRPPYFGEIVRSHRRLYNAPGVEPHFLKTLIRELARKYLGEVADLAEFGSGPGQNLTNLVTLDGRRKYRGYDWSQEACRRVYERGFETGIFDMFRPEEPMKLDGVLTVHAMEQLGASWGPFLNFLHASRPKICIHIEPIYELYDPEKLMDFLAMRYHEKRRYLVGFLPALQTNAVRGIAEIIEVRRMFFGNLYHEAYSVVVWRPR